MPSWNEKAHVIPTVNVNLKKCEHPDLSTVDERGWHPLNPNFLVCHAGPPIFVPLPLEPHRSVTFTVRLGACTCPWAKTSFSITGPHQDDCPARPVKVTCSISGKTWEESEVTDPEGHGVDGRLVGFAFASPVHVACRDRWALVKALVTGGWPTVSAIGVLSESIPALVSHRDAVFAAIADMVRLEEAMLAAQQRTVAAIASPRLTASATSPEGRPSAQALAVYVERLIEQVGVLP